MRGILGFTRESLIATTTNIESREWKRQSNANAGIPSEHPRASTTDDVECFFSVLRDLVGKDFTLKDVKYSWRKVCSEFSKRLDLELPCYYYTSAHDRFHEGPRPAFDLMAPKPRKEPRVPRQEQPGAFVSGRATLPVRSSLSLRPTFHNKPVSLPPPPSAPQHLSEHSYV